MIPWKLFLLAEVFVMFNLAVFSVLVCALWEICMREVPPTVERSAEAFFKQRNQSLTDLVREGLTPVKTGKEN